VAGCNDHLPVTSGYHYRESDEALDFLSVPCDSRSEVVILKLSHMDIAPDHFQGQAVHNGVASSADLHLKGALHKRS
jgi:hypothetical protein